MTTVWGVHNDTLADELLTEGFISAGWDRLGDLREVPDGREGLKRELAEWYPDDKPRAIAGWAGILLRLRDEMKPGDIVVAPYRPDSTINIGVITSGYWFAAEAPTHRHRRSVSWSKAGLSRASFSQSALYEIGSLLTVFQIRKHAEEFLAVLDAEDVDDPARPEPAELVPTDPEIDAIDEPRASRIERHTRDFILEALHREITHVEFEEFAADLLRSMGYQARVTQYSQDGGVDVIAHRDPLGVEPPQIKVQVKHRTGTVGAPEVQQLIGTQQPGEFLLFITLGAYSKDARSIERQRSGLRLMSGEDVVGLAIEHYDKLPARWRDLIPLTPVLVVADSADA